MQELDLSEFQLRALAQALKNEPLQAKDLRAAFPEGNRKARRAEWAKTRQKMKRYISKGIRL